MSYPKGRTKDEYEMRKIQGKHGEINLMIPKWEPTQQEIDEFYQVIAEIRIDEYKRKMRKKRENRND